MEIYVVDDDLISRMALIDVAGGVMGSSAIYTEFETADAAWEQLNKGEALPSLVCCDIRMPGMSGLELLAKVRGLAKTKDLSFCLISSANDPDTIKKAVAHGVSGFLIKPFSHDDATARLTKVLAEVRAKTMEPPKATMSRLKITAERYKTYITGLRGQISQLISEVDASTNEESWNKVIQKCATLESGCVTLGMRNAALTLGRVKDGKYERIELMKDLTEIVQQFQYQIYSVEA